jgi:hypothetical protein
VGHRQMHRMQITTNYIVTGRYPKTIAAGFVASFAQNPTLAHVRLTVEAPYASRVHKST